MNNLPLPVTSALAALGHALGDHIELDDDGECGLLFADDVEVVVAYAAEQELLSVRTAILATAASAELLHDALALNYGDLVHERVAIDAQTDALVLLTSCDARSVIADEFLERVAGIVAAAPQVRERLLRQAPSGSAWESTPWTAGERA